MSELDIQQTGRGSRPLEKMVSDEVEADLTQLRLAFKAATEEVRRLNAELDEALEEKRYLDQEIARKTGRRKEAEAELAEARQEITRLQAACRDALRVLMSYMPTEAQMLDYAALNDGRASGYDVAMLSAFAALAYLDPLDGAGVPVSTDPTDPGLVRITLGRVLDMISERDALPERNKLLETGMAEAMKENGRIRLERDEAKRDRDSLKKRLDDLESANDEGLVAAYLETHEECENLKKRLDGLVEALESIIIRCDEGSRETNWLPTISRISKAALSAAQDTPTVAPERTDTERLDWLEGNPKKDFRHHVDGWCIWDRRKEKNGYHDVTRIADNVPTLRQAIDVAMDAEKET